MADREHRRMLAPIWLDEQDQASIENLQKSLWARTKQDAFLHSLRWAVKTIRKSRAYHKPFARVSDRAFAEGKALTLRLTEEQREYLDKFAAATQSQNSAEAVRLVIRMAEHYFAADE